MKMTPEKIDQLMSDCTLCPRKCHVNRCAGAVGFCGQSAQLRAARAALHFWEEPCICGPQGSGAVFFSGCSLGCVFCQNRNIALGKAGRLISLQRLTRIFLELQEQGAANINLVTAGHFLPQICFALANAKEQGLSLPVVYNSSGYEEASSLRLLDGLVDIYLPDLKYLSPQLSGQWSQAQDYFQKASLAIAEMFRQTGPPVIDPETGLMKRGLIVRHLLLPGQTADAKRILRYLRSAYGTDIYVSILNQYTPMSHLAELSAPEISLLKRPVTETEYARVISFAEQIGIEQGYIQEEGTALESFIPEFDGKGL